MRIPLAKPWVLEEDLEYLRRPVKRGWLTQGFEVMALEEAIGRFTGTAHAVALCSGTAALAVGLRAIGIGPGDAVIVPALTFVATAHAIHHAGARPIFVDVDPLTWTLAADAALAAHTPDVAALLPVHLFGLPADLPGLRDLAQSLGIALIEDAAGALGASGPDGRIGEEGDAVALSFHPRKLLTTGEGGMLLTEQDDVARRARAIRDQGRPDYAVDAFNWRMSDLAAAMGLAQMGRIERALARRRELAARYTAHLEGLPLRPQQTPSGFLHAYQAYAVCLDETAPPRAEILRRLAARGIEAAEASHAPVALAYYRDRFGLRPEDFPTAMSIHERGLALPLYPQLTDEEQEAVVRGLRACLLGSGEG